MLYLTVLAPLLAHFIPTEDKRVKLAISIAPAIFIILFRFGLGTDYFSYQYLYNNHDVTTFMEALKSQSYSMEVGFRILVYVFRSLYLPYQVFIATISFVIYAFFLKWIDDTDLDLALSIMLLNGMFFVVWSLGAIRQGLILAIGTYFFFNKKINLSLGKSIIVIIILGQFHASAYIYFLFIFLKRFDFKKKYLIGFLIVSIIFSGIPYYNLLLPFQEYRLAQKFISYASETVRLFDFPGIVRLLFSVYILVFYNYFKKDPYIKKLADLSLIGFGFYFFLKSSELVANRINIFTFILMIPLFVYLTMEFFNNKILYALAIIGTFSFSMAYIQKDLMATQNQVGLADSSRYYKLRLFNTVDYQDYYNYDNLYSSIHFNYNYCKENLRAKSPLLQAESLEGYMVIRDRKKKMFGVINNKGEWQIKPIFGIEPDIYGDTLVFNDPIWDDEDDDSGFNNSLEDEEEKWEFLPPHYLNVKNEDLEEVYSTILINSQIQKAIDSQEPLVERVNINKYVNDLLEFFPDSRKIAEPKIITYSQPFEYKVLHIKYYRNNYYLHLNEDLDLHNGMIFTKELIFDHNNLAVARGFCSNVVLNSNGEIVYK